MASTVNGYIGQINPGDGINYALGSTAYGVCGTAAATAAKTVDMTGFTLTTGATIHVKFTNSNTVANPTLNVNGTGAKAIYRYGTSSPSTTQGTSWHAGAVISFTYDGSAWIMNDWLNYNTTYESKAAASGGTDVSLVTTGEKYTWNAKGTYSKPSGGIPDSDIASASTWNAKGTYSKPSGGIPKTDLASDVQTSLGKADTALQSHQDISGKLDSSLKGAANGLAELDATGKVPSSQLPADPLNLVFVRAV